LQIEGALDLVLHTGVAESDCFVNTAFRADISRATMRIDDIA
jgi:hypothetical protein